jgi:hypothetical protein
VAPGIGRTELRADRQSSRASIRSGLKLGLITATLFSLAVTVQRLLLGPGAFAHLEMSWGQIVAVYYAAFSLGGCGYGALLPLRQRHSWAAAMSGVVFISPMYLGLALLMNRMFGSLQIALIVGALLSIVGGAVLGVFWWDDDRQQEKPEVGGAQRSPAEGGGLSQTERGST